MYSVLFMVYSVWEPCRKYTVTCSLCSERNKASDAETVSTDCRHLEQLLCRHYVYLPSNGVPANFISYLLSDDSKLDNKSPDPC